VIKNFINLSIDLLSSFYAIKSLNSKFKWKWILTAKIGQRLSKSKAFGILMKINCPEMSM